MSSMVRRGSRFAITIALVAATVSCASAPPASPKLMARCTQLYALWARYEPIFTLIHTGQKAQAELALEDCRNGRYEDGLQALERLLRRGRIAVPPN